MTFHAAYFNKESAFKSLFSKSTVKRAELFNTNEPRISQEKMSDREVLSRLGETQNSGLSESELIDAARIVLKAHPHAEHIRIVLDEEDEKSRQAEMQEQNT